ncbi:hypothetical protein [Hyalangium minutum]|uniref:LysR substrate-binding domain-containing protein n=1 Tax=Hyalangium minutum TaxID=394096 RepID=A0A085W8D6_9BACT|nr:hypothetical protein [Hyalangium minutum]KFE63949.1 hypothetical protein DB31_2361 [Hyalangium minutum]
MRTFKPRGDSLVARKVGQLAWRLYATGKYLERAPPLKAPPDLAQHELVGFDAALSEAAAAHQGVASLPCILAGRYPQLRPVLPEVELPMEDVWRVSSREARQVERVRGVMGFLSEQFERMRAEMLGVR